MDIRILLTLCPTEPEEWNEYLDDDGCPDSVDFKTVIDSDL